MPAAKTGEFWAVSQAAPMRRVNVNGNTTFMDYCTGPSFASGGFIADSNFTGGNMINGSQQQFFVRNTAIDELDQRRVEPGVRRRPRRPRAVLPRRAERVRPVHDARDNSGQPREALPLRRRPRARGGCSSPLPRTNSSGTSWSSGPDAGRSIPLSHFFVAKPSDSVKTMNRALARGQNLLLTPGVYETERSIKVNRRGRRRARPRAGHADRRTRRDTASRRQRCRR